MNGVDLFKRSNDCGCDPRPGDLYPSIGPQQVRRLSKPAEVIGWDIFIIKKLSTNFELNDLFSYRIPTIIHGPKYNFHFLDALFCSHGMLVDSRSSRYVKYFSKVAVIIAHQAIVPSVIEAAIIGIYAVIYQFVLDHQVPASGECQVNSVSIFQEGIVANGIIAAMIG